MAAPFLNTDHAEKLHQKTEPKAEPPVEKPAVPGGKPEQPAPAATGSKRALSDLAASRASNIAHVLLAIGAGWLAPQFNNDLTGGAVGIVLLLAVGYGLTVALGRKGVKWWLQNGLIVYLFFFLVSWAWMIN